MAKEGRGTGGPPAVPSRGSMAGASWGRGKRSRVLAAVFRCRWCLTAPQSSQQCCEVNTASVSSGVGPSCQFQFPGTHSRSPEDPCPSYLGMLQGAVLWGSEPGQGCVQSGWTATVVQKGVGGGTSFLSLLQKNGQVDSRGRAEVQS